MLTSLSHYFLSEWLWSLTLGLYHMPINIFIMIGLSIFILRQRTVPAVLLSVSANLFSFLIFIAIGYVLHIDYVPEHDDIYVITNMALGCGALGIIYAVDSRPVRTGLQSNPPTIRSTLKSLFQQSRSVHAIVRSSPPPSGSRNLQPGKLPLLFEQCLDSSKAGG